MNVVTRFPPSPTGYLHIGRARTALFNYFFAKKHGGKMVFRLEDTDQARSKKEYEEDIIECLKWLNIAYEEGPFRQSERSAVYKRYIETLIATGHAFESNEEVEGSKARSTVIRFKNPNKKIVFDDLIRGRIEFDTTELGDFVIARSMTEPVYHLAVVIDDFDMGITHVIRGEDGISNTPRQILIQDAIGAPRPIYAHLPLILAADKSKLSGRHGAVSVTEYRNMGYLPEALINFLALLGWNPGTNQEIFSIDELVQAFDIEKIQKAGAVFNLEKLTWFNRQYIVKLSDSEFTERSIPFLPEWLSKSSDLFKRLLPLLREKTQIFSDITKLFDKQGELAFVHRLSDYPAEMLLWKKEPEKVAAKAHLEKARELLAGIDGAAFSADAIKAAIWPYAEEKGKGNVLWPLRVALTGQEKSPDPVVSAYILGQKESLSRIDGAIKKLS